MLTVCFAVAFFVVLNPALNSTFAYLGFPDIPFVLNDLAICLVGLFSFFCALRRVLSERKVDAFLVCMSFLFCVVLFASMIFPTSTTAGVLSLGGKYPFSSVHVFLVDWVPVVSAALLVFAFHDAHQERLIEGVLIACAVYTLLNMKSLVEQIYSFTEINDLSTGYRNCLFRIIIPSYICAWLVYLRRGAGWIVLPIVFYILGFIQVIGAYSATSVCAMALMGILTITLLWKGPRRYLNALSYAIGYVILFLGFIIFRVQEAFSPLLQALFQRSATFTGRTLIWGQVAQSLQDFHLFVGYGVGYMYQVIKVNGAVYKHAHNEFLHMLMSGGIFALALYVAMFALSVRRLYLGRKSSEAAALAIGLAGFLLISLTEVAFSPGLFFILAASYYFFDDAENRALRKERQQ